MNERKTRREWERVRASAERKSRGGRSAFRRNFLRTVKECPAQSDHLTICDPRLAVAAASNTRNKTLTKIDIKLLNERGK